MTHTRLNIFQRLVRQWDELHPYNAAHVMQLEGEPDGMRLRETWMQTLRALGLGKARLNGRSFHFEPLNGHWSDDICQVSGRTLEEHISDEMNRPFDLERELPFRAFLARDAGSYYAGVIYHHWIADSASIRMLMKEWLVRSFSPAQARQRPLRFAEDGYWSLFGTESGRWRLIEAVLASARWQSRFRRTRRIEWDTASMDVSCSLYRAPGSMIKRLYHAAHRAGITVNDVITAAAAEACDRFLPLPQMYQRTDLAVASIVDLRRLCRHDLSDTFGLFLGFTSTICKPGELSDWKRLLRSVANQNRLHRQSGAAQASVVRMAVSLAAERVLSRQRLASFYRKRVPLAAGISNVNLNRDWPAQFQPSPLLNYLRFAPTGPLMPLALTTTTLGDEFHIGLTRRVALVDDEMAKVVASSILERLRHVADCGEVDTSCDV